MNPRLRNTAALLGELVRGLSAADVSRSFSLPAARSETLGGEWPRRPILP